LGYYKWFDAGLSQVLAQLMPASADFVPELYNVVESHVLERPKYETKFPTLESNAAEPDGYASGWQAQKYPGSLGGSTVPQSPRDTTRHIPFWKQRALRNAPEITSGDATIDTQRETYRKVINSVPHLSSSQPIISTFSNTKYAYDDYASRAFAKTYNLEVQNPETTVIKGGVNFESAKNIDYTYVALRPAGPVNTAGGVYIPTNVLLSFVKDFAQLPVNNDPPKEPAKKVKRTVKVVHGRDYDEGVGYHNLKSTLAFPFNIISASVTGGYSDKIDRKLVGNIEITNLHNDVYGPDMEVPMQGPFTNYAVGGHQSRHIKLNAGPTLDNYLTRPEAWKLLLGCVLHPSGAIGMVGPDYPYPEANAVGEPPYPMTGAQKAYLYRDFIAKRPVNIRNIRHTTGSTILGNYNQQYEILMTNGAYSNPRHFVDNQPSLPSQVFQGNTTGATSVRTFLDLRRGTDSHFEFVSEYSTGYLTGTNNQSVIRGTFAAPGGMDTMTLGYEDFRAAEYSVYNALPFRNLGVLGHSQPSNVSQSQIVGSSPVQSRVSDIHGRDYGLRPLLSRHAGKFFRDSLFQTNPGASYDQLPAFHRIHRNSLTRLTINADLSYASGTVYDNAFVSHQIPRSTQQYAWITGNVIADNNIYGYTPTDFYISDSVGIREAYTWATSGSFGSYLNASNERKYGKDRLDPFSTFDGFLTNPFLPLNLNITQELTESSNTIGLPTTSDVIGYVNTSFAGVIGAAPKLALVRSSMLNSLLITRNGPYGYPSWQQLRNNDNPILSLERINNKISVASDDRQSITRYDMPPVSMRGRPIYININAQTGQNQIQNTTFKAAYNNEGIYFNTNELSDRFDIDLDSYTTAFDQLVKVSKDPKYALNWILYSENIFPSQRNEFITRTSDRTGYDNNFWRSSRADRRLSSQTNTWNMTNRSGLNWISASMFALDAPYDFLTRTQPPHFCDFTASLESVINVATRNNILASGAAGELQNTYTSYATSSYYSGSMGSKTDKFALGSLYARKQTIGSPWSVASRSGIVIPATGSGDFNNALSESTAIEIFGGEAVWQAGPLAGIVEVQNKTASFVSYPSEPWFDTYNNFRYQLKTVAKDFGIVPEFRISEHIKEFAQGGILNPAKTDNFEIPGTSKNSTSSSFYRDYSNTEFLQNFAKIKNQSNLDPKEIKLVVSASVRFNPYEGFYPAQRTLQVVNDFVDTYTPNMRLVMGSGVTAPSEPDSGTYSALRNIANIISSPGILYNSIKSGIAVDYPIQNSDSRISASVFGEQDWRNSNWAMVTAYTSSLEKFAQTLSGATWDVRAPFETIIYPEKYLNGITVYDNESNPSASFNVAGGAGTGKPGATLVGNPASDLYSRISKNFFGGVADFFLKDSQFTKLESATVPDDLKFIAGETYMARVKILRSTSGSRDYGNEKSTGGGRFSQFGAQPYYSSTQTYAPGPVYYPLPQDPQRAPSFRETFTMYSRPTAFGPPIAGCNPLETTSSLTGTSGLYVHNTIYDSFMGYNPAYTPPYTDGEAWADLIFRPSASVAYDLERIMSEISVEYWRFDPGPIMDGKTQYIFDQIISGTAGSGQITASAAPYSGRIINANSMQLNASVDLFGVERVQLTEKDKFGNKLLDRNTTAGSKWIIQPKFETPMLNFNDNVNGINPLSSSMIDLPVYASASVPRGMWHQFGVIPKDPNTGVFLEIGDIPREWLRYHYNVINTGSIYNDFAAESETREATWQNVKSLSSLMGFDKVTSRRRLGEIKDSLTVKEAIVAVPYILTEVRSDNVTGTQTSTTAKSFITIPKARFNAALNSEVGSKEGDSLETAGASIRDQIQKMQTYVMPPEFNFIGDTSIDPVVMYIFEFSYTFDKDDLSYMWQNLAPRNYKQISFQSDSVTHTLANNELLSQKNLIDNPNLRWMVFKVKQKSQADYFDYVATQRGQASKELFKPNQNTNPDIILPDPNKEYLQYNWPYDYLSFVELIKMDAEVLYNANASNDAGQRPSQAAITDLEAQNVQKKTTAAKGVSQGAKTIILK